MASSFLVSTAAGLLGLALVVGCTGVVGDPYAPTRDPPDPLSVTGRDAGRPDSASARDASTTSGQDGEVPPLPPPPRTEAYDAFLAVWRVMNPVVGQRQRCAQCHAGGGPGRPDHSVDDPLAAYQAARTVIDPANPTASKLYTQAQTHQPVFSMQAFDALELAAMLHWISLETAQDPGTPPPPPVITDRAPQYALALSSAALRIAQVPAHFAELADIESKATPAEQRAAYERYVDLYLSSEATPVELPMASGARRPGIVQNVFYNAELWPNYPADPLPESQDVFRLTQLDFDTSANRGSFLLYPSPLSRLALQWIGFGGIRSSRNNSAVPNQDNYGALDALIRTVLEDRPVRQAFQTDFVDADGTPRQTRACIHVPYAGYQVPVMHRQVCRAGAEVTNAAPQGAPVPGGILGSRSFQRVEYGHYKFHTLRAAFRSFHCKDFPVFSSNLVVNGDDSAARAKVVSPWSDTNTTPYCASCHAGSAMNLMALTFWRFDDDTGVLYPNYRARRPTEERVRGATDLVDASVDASKYYYKDQVLDSMDAWMTAFVDDPDFTRCSVAQIYNYVMGRGAPWTKEHAVPAAKVDELIAAYESAYGAGSARDLTVRRMLAVALKSDDFTHR